MHEEIEAKRFETSKQRGIKKSSEYTALTKSLNEMN